MTAAFDITIAVILIVFCVIGAKKGFVRTLFNMLGSIGALVLAWLFGGRLAEYLNGRYIGPFFKKTVTEYFERISAGTADSENKIGEFLQQKIDNLPQVVQDFIKGQGVDVEEVVEAFAGGANLEEATASAIETIYTPIASIASGVAGFVLLFLGVVIAARLLGLIAGALFDLPVLRTLNGGMGLLLGVVEGALFAFVFVFVISLLFPYLEGNDILGLSGKSLDDTVLFSWFSRNNPLVWLFDGVK